MVSFVCKVSGYMQAPLQRVAEEWPVLLCTKHKAMPTSIPFPPLGACIGKMRSGRDYFIDRLIEKEKGLSKYRKEGVFYCRNCFYESKDIRDFDRHLTEEHAMFIQAKVGR